MVPLSIGARQASAPLALSRAFTNWPADGVKYTSSPPSSRALPNSAATQQGDLATGRLRTADSRSRALSRHAKNGFQNEAHVICARK